MTLALLLLAATQPFAGAGPAAECLLLRHHGRQAEAAACFTRLAAGPDAWARAEGLWGLGRFSEANDEFRTAVKLRPKDPDLRVRWGRLLLERFNPPEAAELFQEALELSPNHPGALVGLAWVAAEQFESKAVELARQALAADAGSVEAHELLARMALEEGDIARAIEHADRALALWPEALDAMSIHATIHWLADQPQSPWLKRIFAVNPRYGQAYATAARFMMLNRRYEDAIALLRKAVELDPQLWSAHSELGLNLMRMGRDAEARRELELAYLNGYRNATTVNALRLLDSYKNFVLLDCGRVVLKLHRKEADVLRPYFQELAEKALSVFENKYGLRLQQPVRIEVYPDHEDFAVRTVGMPGLGALGVTFGYVVAMDSPSARPRGAFHWASTLWHELNHVVVLAATAHRVPRWFIEGLAVYEESLGGPGWGERLTPEVIAAIRDKKLLPVSELDRGFVRPRYPSQVVVSYYQAGRMCEYIAEQWGVEKLRGMVSAFARGADTPQAVRQVLGTAPEELDARFIKWLESRTSGVLEGFEQWRRRLSRLQEAARAGRHEEVIRDGPAVRDLYPDYVGVGSAYELLAEAWLARNDKAAARGELERYQRAGGRDVGLLKKLAALELETGRGKEAAEVLSRMLEVDPLHEESHRLLGNLRLEMGDAEGAIREYRAALALNPNDVAAAHFNLARAYHAAQRVEEAKEHVLAALELAPGYRLAQKLLLELNP